MSEEPDEVTLPPAPRSVSAARLFVRHRATPWLNEEALDRLVLAVSEAVTNAIKHARSAVVVRLRRRPHTVRVEVDDASPALPIRSDPAPDGEHEGGRGLDLIEALADDWGVERHPNDGKTVWIDIALRPDEPRHDVA